MWETHQCEHVYINVKTQHSRSLLALWRITINPSSTWPCKWWIQTHTYCHLPETRSTSVLAEVTFTLKACLLYGPHIMPSTKYFFKKKLIGKTPIDSTKYESGSDICLYIWNHVWSSSNQPTRTCKLTKLYIFWREYLCLGPSSSVRTGPLQYLSYYLNYSSLVTAQSRTWFELGLKNSKLEFELVLLSYLSSLQLIQACQNSMRLKIHGYVNIGCLIMFNWLSYPKLILHTLASYKSLRLRRTLC